MVEGTWEGGCGCGRVVVVVGGWDGGCGRLSFVNST